LVAAGETVYDINPRWTAQERRRARNRSKSDVRDAHAIALYVWQQGSSLPVVSGEDATAVLAILVGQRQAAVAEATRLRNQAHQLLLQADPAYRDHLPALTTQAGIAALEQYQAPDGGLLAVTRAAAIRLLGQRLRLAVEQAAALARHIEVLARTHFAPLLRLKGVQAMTAATLAVILGPGRRFRTDAELALYAGVAPLEVSSAGRVRQRLNRSGNRQLNALLYRIAITQLGSFPPAQAYVARRLSEGKSKREAIRALKRHLMRVVFGLWLECLRGAPSRPAAQAA
jgi:transposase